jgi:hypothetical protein
MQPADERDLPGKERSLRGEQRGSDQRRGEPHIRAPGDQEHERKQEIELELDADRPRMREDAEAVGVGIFRDEREVGGQPRHEGRVLVAQRRQRITRQPVDQDRRPVARHDPEEAPDQEGSVRHAPDALLLAHRQHGHEISAHRQEDPHGRPALQVIEQVHARDMGGDDEQQSEAAQPVECRTVAGRQVILVAQFVGRVGQWHCAGPFGHE